MSITSVSVGGLIIRGLKVNLRIFVHSAEALFLDRAFTGLYSVSQPGDVQAVDFSTLFYCVCKSGFTPVLGSFSSQYVHCTV
jgi:hypothetical protein